jgi:hypothetical protein
MMKSMFSGRCGMRVNANGMHNVIKTMRNVIKRTHLDKVYVLIETWYEGEVKLQHKVIQYVRNAHFDRWVVLLVSSSKCWRKSSKTCYFVGCVTGRLCVKCISKRCPCETLLIDQQKACVWDIIGTLSANLCYIYEQYFWDVIYRAHFEVIIDVERILAYSEKTYIFDSTQGIWPGARGQDMLFCIPAAPGAISYFPMIYWKLIWADPCCSRKYRIWGNPQGRLTVTEGQDTLFVPRERN